MSVFRKQGGERRVGAFVVCFHKIDTVERLERLERLVQAVQFSSGQFSSVTVVFAASSLIEYTFQW